MSASLRLNPLEPVVNRLAEVPGGERDARQRQQRDERQPDVDPSIMIATAITNPRAVLAKYMTAGPTIMRTALKSLVARDMRSPVRLA